MSAVRGLSSLQQALKSNVKEIRLHMCQTSIGSAGIREFVHQCYVPLKIKNPECPILIRECQGVSAKLYARFDKGVEKSASLENKSLEQVVDILNSTLHM